MNLAQFSVYKIINTKEKYERILQENTLINFDNIMYIINKTYNIEVDIEYSLFSIGKEIIYDNKNKGGRIIFNLINTCHNLNNNNINSIYYLYPIKNNNISLMQRYFFIFAVLLMVKNIHINNLINNNTFLLKFIKSIEGIILQKNYKSIKLVISFDEDYSDNELSIICNIIKNILGFNPNLTFKYNSYKNVDKSQIIK